jgi:hypothetical protein
MSYDDLLARLRAALENDEVKAADLERLLRDRRFARPDAGSILSALGLAVAFAGAALIYATGYRDLSHSAQIVTPFAFPAVALTVAVLLALVRRPRWQAETAGFVGQVALAAAFVLAEGELRPENIAVYGAVCGLVGVIEVLACHHAIGSARLTGWGLSASLVALVNFSSAAIGDGRGGDQFISLAGLVLIEAVFAATVAAVLFARDSEFGVHAARTASLLAYAAAVVGQQNTIGGPYEFTIWIAVISVAVVATFLVAAALRLDALVWVGALGGVVWMVLVTRIAGTTDTDGATMVLLGGLGLAALGFVVAQLRKVTRPATVMPVPGTPPGPPAA